MSTIVDLYIINVNHCHRTNSRARALQSSARALTDCIRIVEHGSLDCYVHYCVFVCRLRPSIVLNTALLVLCNNNNNNNNFIQWQECKYDVTTVTHCVRY